MDDIPSTSSYLDLEDPFHTIKASNNDLFKLSAPYDKEKNNESFERNSDMLKHQIVPLINGCDDENDDILQHCFPSSREIIDGPQEWDFSQYAAYKPLPDNLRERTDSILSVDIQNHTFSEEKLKNLVMVAAKLLTEHDLLLNSREKLVQAMKKMHQSEKEAAMKLISELNVGTVDAESRKLIMDMSDKLAAMNTESEEIVVEIENKVICDDQTIPKTEEKENNTINAEMKVLPLLFTVPPPDPSRPPPGFLEHCVSNVKLSTLKPPELKSASPPIPVDIQKTRNTYHPRFSSPQNRTSPLGSGFPTYQLPPPAFVQSMRPYQFLQQGKPRYPLQQPNGPTYKPFGVFPTPGGPRRRFSTGLERKGRGGTAYKK